MNLSLHDEKYFILVLIIIIKKFKQGCDVGIDILAAKSYIVLFFICKFLSLKLFLAYQIRFTKLS